MNIVEQNINAVSQFCKKHFVENMYVFGSVLTKEFSPASDIDFLVNFGKVKPESYFENIGRNFTDFYQNLIAIRWLEIVDDCMARLYQKLKATAELQIQSNAFACNTGK